MPVDALVVLRARTQVVIIAYQSVSRLQCQAQRCRRQILAARRQKCRRAPSNARGRFGGTSRNADGKPCAGNQLTGALTLQIGSIASAAGVGGGAFFVPLFNFLLGFTVKGATSLSQATITGGSLAAVAISMTKTHPVDPTKPLIDYTLSLLLLPVLLLGVSLGEELRTESMANHCSATSYKSRS